MRVKIMLSALLVVALFACGGGGGGNDHGGNSSAVTLVSITVTPSNPNVTLGTPQQFTS